MQGNKLTKDCPYCGEEILAVAIKCKHCGEFLNGAMPNSKDVVISGVDPFAEYHTNIQGKKKGNLTAVGFLGIFLGCGLFFVGCPLLLKYGHEEHGFSLCATGLFFAIASYLWARTPSSSK